VDERRRQRQRGGDIQRLRLTDDRDLAAILDWGYPAQGGIESVSEG
jgi:hypothetical protein